MLVKEEEAVRIDEDVRKEVNVPEVEVHGDQAFIRLDTPEGFVEERKVKLPKATWA